MRRCTISKSIPIPTVTIAQEGSSGTATATMPSGVPNPEMSGFVPVAAPDVVLNSETLPETDAFVT